MKYFTTGAKSALIDKISIEEVGMPQMVLMERASLGVAGAAAEFIKDKKQKILTVVEGGNNGGDGVAAARILKERGFNADIFYIGGIKRTSEAFLEQIKIAENCGVKIYKASDDYSLKSLLAGYDIVIDGIFGVGLSREIGGVQAEAINIINDAKEERQNDLAVISIDIPSGVSADNGELLGVAVKADVTVTFGFTKVGMLFGKGREYSGKIILKDIGFPACAVEKTAPEYYGLDIDDIKKILPVRKDDSNKGNFGRLLIVAGNDSIAGAAVIAGQAAFKAGAGLVKIFTHKDNRNIIGAALPEALLDVYEYNSDLEELSDGTNHSAGKCSGKITSPGGEQSGEIISSTDIESLVKWATAIAIGPGLGTSEKSKYLLKAVLKAAYENDKPVVMDADAINIISEDRNILKNLRFEEKKWIITPHMLEMARLIKTEDENTKDALGRIFKDRFEVAKYVSNEYNIISVLKDARTVVSDGSSRCFINTNGNSGMSKGGSGDSLTGIIGALLAEGMKPQDAARAGVFIHGAAGDIAALKCGRTSMTVTDLNGVIDMIKR